MRTSINQPIKVKEQNCKRSSYYLIIIHDDRFYMYIPVVTPSLISYVYIIIVSQPAMIIFAKLVSAEKTGFYKASRIYVTLIHGLHPHLSKQIYI